MQSHKKYFIIMLLFSVCLACISQRGWAQNQEKQFQESKADFLDVFQPKSPPTVRLKGFKTKGLGGIANDFKPTEKPVARSLILFDFDSASVKSESYRILNNLADVLKYKLPDLEIEILGHTDSKGSAEYNFQLSRRRARAVKDVLVSHYGVAPERLKTRGFGEQQPFIANDTLNAKNRRVEFKQIN